MFSATMSRAFTDSMADFTGKILQDAVDRLAAKYGFDAEEAKDFLLAGGVHVKLPPLEKSQLPWCGVVDGACCKAIVKNGGLFTQCTSSPLDGGYCKKCAKDVEKNGTPTNGDVEARLVGDIMAYKIGNTEVKPYIEYMIKHNITQAQAEESAASYGLTIDPRQFEKKKRGRKQTERAMAPSVETPLPGDLAELTETVVSTDLPALHRARAAAAAADPEEVEDDTLTIKGINGMKKEDVHLACEQRGISIEGKNILDLKKALKALVV